jgi:uncharacterized protein
MSEHFGDDGKQQALKEIVQKLHEGVDVAKVRKQFAALIKDVSPEEIAKMEQSLITEGVPVEKVQKMCDVHVAVFEDSLKRQKKQKTLPGHPIRTFVDENKEARRRVRKTKAAIWAVARNASWETAAEELAALKLLELHYSRKENLLFPFLESEKFTGPSKVMWGKHDEIRNMFKETESALRHEDVKRSRSTWAPLARAIRGMVFMEERILFPTALKLLTDRQWADIRKGEAEIGYAWIKPGNLWDANIVTARSAAADLGKPIAEDTGTGETAEQDAAEIPLEMGSMSPQMINILLKNLPLDITYVDEHDRVRYYSQGRERIFPRTPAIIGREVQNCHPPKSVHVVEKIVEDFKSKKRDMAEFWLEMGGKFIHIRYFALFDADGVYRGVLEVSQDATAIRGLKGERRLLDPS